MKKIKILAFILCFSLISFTYVFAEYQSAGWPTNRIPLKSFNYDNTWQVPMENAIRNWNDSDANITFFTNPANTNPIYVQQYSDSWYGLTSLKTDSSKVTSFEIKLNTKNINKFAVNLPNFIESVLTHELGHIIWLADDPPELLSIMNTNRDRNTLTKPYITDINNVRAKYD